MNKGNISEIFSLFRSENPERPILLLGAGSSFKSGVPLASDATKRIVKASYVVNKGLHWKNYDNIKISDWEPYLRKQSWFKQYENNLAEAFPIAVENLLNPREFRREFLLDMVMTDMPISNGYIALAGILQRKLCWTVLTTNFDTLIFDSFKYKAPTKKLFEINKTNDDLVAFRYHNQSQVVYLHGALECYTDKINQGETINLDVKLIRKLKPCLEESPLIIIGYRGAEQSIMKDLLIDGASDCNFYSRGIFWCLMKNEEPHNYVKEFADKIGRNFRFIEIDGFDELMEKTFNELKNEYVITDGIDINSNLNLPFDEKPVDNCTYDDLDEDLIKTTLSKYFERLTISNVEASQYKDFLISEKYLIKDGETLIPTNATFLLFGKNISEKFPFAFSAIELDNKERILFEGNLIEQFNKLSDFFDDNLINPYIRIKKEKDSDEILAYNPRAITELIVNMIVHKDYTINEFNKIEYNTGNNITFVTPGGLPTKVRAKIRPDEAGYFEPIRGLSQIRNNQIADIFYGIGTMDKVGSGMPDVKDGMKKQSGNAEFKILDDNKILKCSLLQALQKAPSINNVADPIVKTELYITNLLPFRVFPKYIYLYPTKELNFKYLVTHLPRKSFLPVYLTDIHPKVKDKKIISFADIEFYKEYFQDIIDFKNSIKIDVTSFISNLDSRRRFVWLTLKHFEFYLNNFKEDGLLVDYKNKRAYFELIRGFENKITYQSRTNRKATRAVVKRRETKRRIYHENEGISFGLEYLGKQFSLIVKPIYMFTKKDGKTPLENYLRSRYSTSRMKFDRNKNVDDDLHFWLKYLSKNSSSINIGGNDIDDLILDNKYIENEIPIEEEYD